MENLFVVYVSVNRRIASYTIPLIVMHVDLGIAGFDTVWVSSRHRYDPCRHL